MKRIWRAKMWAMQTPSGVVIECDGIPAVKDSKFWAESHAGHRGTAFPVRVTVERLLEKGAKK